jgi:hypothetical protein
MMKFVIHTGNLICTIKAVKYMWRRVMYTEFWWGKFLDKNVHLEDLEGDGSAALANS